MNPAVSAAVPHSDRVLESAMRRALEIALYGPDTTENPQVGCVILDADGRIIAEGWHRGAGTAHAEVDALSHLSAKWRTHADTLTAVVTLEPCNHTGRTGPCASALVDFGIGSVVYALRDPGVASAYGASLLEKHGVCVRGGVLAGQAAAQLSWWLDKQPGGAYVRVQAIRDSAVNVADSDMPYITVKWAQTLDGRAYAADGTSQWITGPIARQDVHFRRAAADAIITSTGTIYADNPSLTARDVDGKLLVKAENQPVPIVFGNRNIPESAYIHKHPALAGKDIFQYRNTSTIGGLQDALRDIKSKGFNRVFMEAGATLVSAFIAAGCVSEYLIYQAPALLGGKGVALSEIGAQTIADIRKLEVIETIPLGADTLLRAVNLRG